VRECVYEGGLRRQGDIDRGRQGDGPFVYREYRLHMHARVGPVKVVDEDCGVTDFALTTVTR
jgi:hypothetical protein